MALNKRLLRKVRNRIAKIPESYRQDAFYAQSTVAPCGTVACLAGETIIVSLPTVKNGVESLRRTYGRTNHWSSLMESPVAKRAMRLLGIDLEEAEALFAGDGTGWPAPYCWEFIDASNNEERAKVAVAYLDECLKRGRVTW